MGLLPFREPPPFPQWVAERLVYPLSDRLTGKKTLPVLTRLQAAEGLESEKLLALQRSALQEIVRHAARTVPYYREVLRAHGGRPDDFREPTDLSRLPLLTKAIVQERSRDLLSRPPLRAERVYTSGTTGEPASFLIDRAARSFQFANQLRGRSWHHVRVGTPELRLWGRPVVSADGRSLSRVARHLNRVKNTLLNVHLELCHDLSEERMSAWVALLRRRRIEVIYGYAVAIYFLARFVHESAVPLGRHHVRTIILTAEKIDRKQKRFVGEVFGARVIEEYGTAECGVLAFECPAGSLHLSEETAVLEVLAPDASGVGELAVTHLRNRAMPLIRYLTGDVVQAARDPCRCGRSSRVLADVLGRTESLIKKPAGGYAHPYAFMLTIQRFEKISRYRIVQRADGALDVLLQLRTDLTSGEAEALRTALAAELGPAGRVSLKPVERLSSDSGGKYQFIRSEVGESRSRDGADA